MGGIGILLWGGFIGSLGGGRCGEGVVEMIGERVGTGMVEDLDCRRG